MKNTVATWRCPWIGTHSPCQFGFVHIMRERGHCPGQPCMEEDMGQPPARAGGQGPSPSQTLTVFCDLPSWMFMSVSAQFCAVEVSGSFQPQCCWMWTPRMLCWPLPADTRESLVHGKPRGNVWLLQISLLQWSCWQEQCNHIIYHEVCSSEPPPFGREKDLN